MGQQCPHGCKGITTTSTMGGLLISPHREQEPLPGCSITSPHPPGLQPSRSTREQNSSQDTSFQLCHHGRAAASSTEQGLLDRLPELRVQPGQDELVPAHAVRLFLSKQRHRERPGPIAGDKRAFACWYPRLAPEDQAALVSPAWAAWGKQQQMAPGGQKTPWLHLVCSSAFQSTHRREGCGSRV